MNTQCFKCKCTEELIQIERGGEMEFVCSDCRDAYLKKCSSCGEYVSLEEDDYVTDRNGELYCESCRDELSYCEHCDEYSDSDNFVHIVDSDQWWCDDCADSYAYRCEECGDWISNNCGDDNTLLYNSCYADHYCTCDDCSEVIHNDNAHFCDDGTYCQYCYDENHSSNVHEYSYSPYLNFLSSDEDDENKLAYLGFELEAGGLSSASVRNNIAESISDNEKTFFLKEDGSIPEYGFELVSHPITLKRHKELDWESIFQQMSNAGMKSHDLVMEKVFFFSRNDFEIAITLIFDSSKIAIYHAGQQKWYDLVMQKAKGCTEKFYLFFDEFQRVESLPLWRSRLTNTIENS